MSDFDRFNAYVYSLANSQIAIGTTKTQHIQIINKAIPFSLPIVDAVAINYFLS
jgi:hypothetical protein